MKISHMQTSFIGVYANVSISTLHCNLTNHCSATSIIGINYSTCYSKIIIYLLLLFLGDRVWVIIQYYVFLIAKIET